QSADVVPCGFANDDPGHRLARLAARSGCLDRYLSPGGGSCDGWSQTARGDGSVLVGIAVAGPVGSVHRGVEVCMIGLSDGRTRLWVSGMDKVDAVVARIETTMRAGRVPGLSIAVVGPQGVCWMRGFGVTDLVGGEPAGVRTPYLWFSMTKIVTATAVMRLAGIGALDLDGPVAEYLLPQTREQYGWPKADAQAATRMTRWRTLRRSVPAACRTRSNSPVIVAGW